MKAECVNFIHSILILIAPTVLMKPLSTYVKAAEQNLKKMKHVAVNVQHVENLLVSVVQAAFVFHVFARIRSLVLIVITLLAPA